MDDNTPAHLAKMEAKLDSLSERFDEQAQDTREHRERITAILSSLAKTEERMLLFTDMVSAINKTVAELRERSDRQDDLLAKNFHAEIEDIKGRFHRLMLYIVIGAGAAGAGGAEFFKIFF